MEDGMNKTVIRVTRENARVFGDSSADEHRLYWDTEREQQDTLGLPLQMAVILAVLESTQSTGERGPGDTPLESWESPPQFIPILCQ